ncbi:MAG: MSHA biogenesis protein MshO, partial [Pseudomonadota bacterium]
THQFVSESAANRVYFVSAPVSYCVSGDRLWRYSGYGFAAVQPTVADLPVGLPDRVLVADNIRAAGTRFTSLPPDLQRNALVEFSLTLAARGAEVAVHSAVQVHNVP